MDIIKFTNFTIAITTIRVDEGGGGDTAVGWTLHGVGGTSSFVDVQDILFLCFFVTRRFGRGVRRTWYLLLLFLRLRTPTRLPRSPRRPPFFLFLRVTVTSAETDTEVTRVVASRVFVARLYHCAPVEIPAR